MHQVSISLNKPNLYVITAVHMIATETECVAWVQPAQDIDLDISEYSSSSPCWDSIILMVAAKTRRYIQEIR